MAIDLNKDNFENEVSTGYTIVDFWATWCGPCVRLKPIFEELSQEMNGIKFAKVQVDKGPEEQTIAGEFGVRGIPCMIIFKDGKEVDRIVGFVQKEDLKTKIEQIVG